ncbi:hypothetical protein D9615_003123 [Tricholomella constricta]|uniref:Ubiquitin-like protease family profile domain-containing protein n=1 Tax=Tricholomella constricta TaxID=117010 RepID=A0A8H5HIW9_9AGAR|nr:hypothetical protein D9615_003123 [Tricholomella constricta]
MAKHNVSGSAADSAPKRTRIDAEEQPVTNGIEDQMYTTWATTVSLWPEVQELCPNGTLSQQLESLQNHAARYFLVDHVPTFDTYCRVDELEGYIQQLDAEAEHHHNSSAHPDLHASFTVAAILPITLLQIRFDMATGQPGLRDQVIDSGIAAAASRMSELSEREKEVIDSLEHFRDGQYLNNAVINFMVEQGASATDLSIKISDTWAPTTHPLYLGQDAPAGSVSGKPREQVGQITTDTIKKKGLWGSEVNPPDTWSRLFMPVHRDDKKHWVVAVADFSEQKITVLDSLRRDDDNERKLCNCIHKYLKYCCREIVVAGTNACDKA